MRKRVTRMAVEGRRRKGRPEGSWMNMYILTVGEEAQNRAMWKQLITNIYPA